jgi:hypothetical protein
MLPRKVAGSFLLVAGVLLLACVSTSAQGLVSARILSSDGAVEIERRAQGQAALTKIDYKVNDELLAGDVIKTYKGGRLVLGLLDGSQAIIGEKTTVELTDLSQSPRTIFNVLRGKTRIKIEKVGGRPNPYRVNTPTAVIAVRGTLFDVLVKDGETQVFVHEGEVAVSSPAAPRASVILSPGLRTRVLEAGPPEAPAHFQPGRNDDTFRPRPRPADRAGHREGGDSQDGKRDAERRRQHDASGGDRNGQRQPPADDPGRHAPQPGGGMGGPGAGPGGRPPLEILLDET